jgi:hypothetical protein
MFHNTKATVNDWGKNHSAHMLPLKNVLEDTYMEEKALIKL